MNPVELIIKNGLSTYKAKYSKVKNINQLKDANKSNGAIFVVREKAHFTSNGVIGYVITSLETLAEDYNGLTHWTPNTYIKYGYKGATKRYIQGFEESNLKQINTFVIDIDTKKHTVQDILLACIDNSIGAPTLIVESDRGYQVYFVLVEPLFISNKNEFRGLTIAKRISDNLKRSLKEVDADIYCNDFGFFRIPTKSNTLYFNANATYSMAELMGWSQRKDDDLNRSLFVLNGNKGNTQATASEWFNALINARDIKGTKGQIGRDNTMFTLALVCFQEGWDKERAFDLLDQFNTNLDSPMRTSEVKKVINSAYSGKYKGAKKEYIESLLEMYVPSTKFDVKMPTGGWYKHKKAREDRVRSHAHEWEKDIIDFITAKKSVSEPFIWRTQKELCKAIGIPASTLNKVLKASKTIIKTTSGKGRNSVTGLTTINLFVQYATELALILSAKKSDYRKWLNDLLFEQLEEMVASNATERLVMYLSELGLIVDISRFERFANSS